MICARKPHTNLAQACHDVSWHISNGQATEHSAQHLLEIVERLERKGVALRLLDFEGHRVDTHSRQGRLLLTMFAAFAQFERESTLERQRDGIAKAEAEGRRKGRKPTAMAKADEVRALAADGVGPSEIARKLGSGRTSVHRVLRG